MTLTDEKAQIGNRESIAKIEGLLSWSYNRDDFALASNQ
jgi:hypothetical protein